MTKKDDSCDCGAIHRDTIDKVGHKIISDSEVKDIAVLLKLFGNTTRVKIMAALNCSDMCVCDIAVLLNMTKSAISHQLKILRNNNLVKFDKKGKHAYYSLADDHVREILNIALEHINE